MNKIVTSIIVVTTLATVSNASWIGIWKPDKKVGNVSLSVGQVTLGTETNPMYTLGLGGNYYYDNGILWGASFGLGYTENPDTTVETKAIGELNAKFKFGYSFGETAKGLGIYGLADFSYLMYNYSSIDYGTGEREDSFSSANGIGYGAGAEYRFDSGWLITASYTTTQMTPDKGVKFDYDKALVGVGFTW